MYFLFRFMPIDPFKAFYRQWIYFKVMTHMASTSLASRDLQ